MTIYIQNKNIKHNYIVHACIKTMNNITLKLSNSLRGKYNQVQDLKNENRLTDIILHNKKDTRDVLIIDIWSKLF